VALLKFEWVNFARRGGGLGPTARIEEASRGGPLTFGGIVAGSYALGLRPPPVAASALTRA